MIKGFRLSSAVGSPGCAASRPWAGQRRALLLGAISILLAAGAAWLWQFRRQDARRIAFLQAALGVERYSEGKYAEAIAAFEEAVRLDRRNARAWYLLGKTQRTLDPQRGLPALERAVRYAPNETSYLREYGLALLDAARIDEARSAFRKCIGIDPSDSQAHVGLARALLARVDSPELMQEAIAELRTALTLQPGDIQARFRLARALFQSGKPDEAQRQFRWTLALLAEGGLRYPGPLDGRTTWSATWLSLVKGCHYYLMQIAHRAGRESEAQSHRQVHSAMDRYIKESYYILGRLNAHPEDRVAQRKLKALFARYGLPPSVDGRASVRRWISPWIASSDTKR